MKEKIAAIFRYIETGAYLEINTHHFKGRIIISDYLLSGNGNPIIPGVGEVVDGQEIYVDLEAA